MSLNTQFLETFKVTETLLKQNGFASFKDYEDSFQDTDPDRYGKLKICRTIRNYLSHENMTFITATSDMVEFLRKENMSFDEGETPVKKKMITLKYAVRETDLITSALGFMLKKNLHMVPVFDDKNFAVGVFSYNGLAGYVAAGDYTKAKKVTNVVEKWRFTFTNENTPMKEVFDLLENPSHVILVLNDDKKVVGWL